MWEEKKYTIREGQLRELLGSLMEGDLIKYGEVRIIPLIKVVRDVTGLALKESKEFVEEVGNSYSYRTSREEDCTQCQGRGYHNVYSWTKRPKSF